MASSSGASTYEPIEVFGDKIYQDSIATALLFPQNSPLEYPIIALNSGEVLTMSFDDLRGDGGYYSYTIYHCNSDWTLSDLNQFDYLGGFTNDDFDDYRFAFNTLQDYTQYRVAFPNNRMHLKLSGNYVFVVYANGDENDVVLTKRFMVYENGPLIVTPELLTPTINRYRYTHQRLRFTVDYSSLPNLSPMTDLEIVVLQNGRWDNALKNLEPTFIRNEELIYDYADQSLFRAGREFRYVDFRNFTFLADRITRITKDDTTNYVHIQRDEFRRDQQYRYWKDLNGRYLIGRFGGLTQMDADYAWVNFSLRVKEPLDSAEVFVFGGFTDWEIQEKMKMNFNPIKQMYEASVYLKQGLYNYEYVVKNTAKDELDSDIFEGNYWQTENDYLILVYHRPFGGRFQKLINYQLINSRVL